MKMRTRAVLLLAPLLVFGGIMASAGASGQEKVTICHAAGLDGTTHYVTLTIAYPAVYGPAGHFFENGTPRAGHEQDYLGPCTPEPTDPPPVDVCPNLEGDQAEPPDDYIIDEDGNCVLPDEPTDPPDPPDPPDCTEDMPCWDCETMGNGICGEWTPSWTPDNGPANPDLSKDLAYTGPATDALPYGILALVSGLGALGAARWAGKRNDSAE